MTGVSEASHLYEINRECFARRVEALITEGLFNCVLEKADLSWGLPKEILNDNWPKYIVDVRQLGLQTAD
jgi:hypothetical protein